MTKSKEPLPGQSSPMRESSVYEEEASLNNLLFLLIREKSLVFIITALFILGAVVYLNWVTPLYKASISFQKPEKLSVPAVIPSDVFHETHDGLFNHFLARVTSFSHQFKVFKEQGFAEKFGVSSQNPEDLERTVLGAHESISFSKKALVKGKKEIGIAYYLEIEGTHPQAIAQFLNAIAESARKDIVIEKQNKVRTIVQDQLAETLNQMGYLRFKAQRDRLSTLKNFKDSLEVAKNLKIKGNNFSLITMDRSVKTSPVVIVQMPSGGEDGGQVQPSRGGIGRLAELPRQSSLLPRQSSLLPRQTSPTWFLYGSEALEEEIKGLESRVNDDSYIEGLSDLEVREKKLRSIDASLLHPEVAVISQPSIPPTSPFEPNSRLVIAGCMTAGFLMAVLVVYIRSFSRTMREDH